MTGQTILIKRYPNRRYYASNTSKYVSLTDIEDMVKSGQTVEIRDSQSGEDMTQTVLTQIIMERHPEKMALFPSDMLHYMLRSNDVMSGFLGDYFRHSLSYLEYLRRHNPAASALAPMQWVKAWLDNSSATVPSEESQPAANPTPEPQDREPQDMEPQDREAQATPPQSPTSESAHLAKRLKQLEERLEQLESGEH